VTAAALLQRHRATFRAIGECIVPDLAHADEGVWTEIEATVMRALDARPAKMRRQLGLLLRVIALLSVVRHGKPITRRTREQREQLMRVPQRSPVKLVRRGVWGLRTLVLMGHYTRLHVMLAVGYRADARGWLARSGTQDAATSPDSEAAAR
jgi:hypothetical protein